MLACKAPPRERRGASGTAGKNFHNAEFCGSLLMMSSKICFCATKTRFGPCGPAILRGFHPSTRPEPRGLPSPFWTGTLDQRFRRWTPTKELHALWKPDQGDFGSPWTHREAFRRFTTTNGFPPRWTCGEGFRPFHDGQGSAPGGGSARSERRRAQDGPAREKP